MPNGIRTPFEKFHDELADTAVISTEFKHRLSVLMQTAVTDAYVRGRSSAEPNPELMKIVEKAGGKKLRANVEKYIKDNR